MSTLLHFTQVPSTQTLATSLYPVQVPTILLADVQTAGIGRTGAWTQTMNPFSASIVLPLTQDLNSVEVSFAMCLIQMFRKIEPDSVFQISYPNDIYKNGVKICGMLVQVGENIVVGVGFNIGAGGEFAFLEKEIDKEQFALELVQNVSQLEKDNIWNEFYDEMIQKDKFCKIKGKRMKICGITQPCVCLMKNEDGEIEEYLGSLKNALE
ncbi:Biotin--[acetyl-CoA-carboxylase]_synthetase [Hexamita inflata]|uniref:Biotin--[acetyl-CoA-carboxylase] synthetase n=1 Tax=Hexamita inflata TaxID=28002 RepID=A0AA86QMP3_9EUKA|nr:Biotin--[acetyl-CoA-carboxylase] synthetase [Hexamita inflata]CAI9961380.1 Biotin--[acetyl-CoA-carboxylase] synthetase [Hexamita inflata]